MARSFSSNIVVASLVIIILAGNQSLHASADSTDPKDFLEAHNAARAKVRVGPMVWSDELASYALKYAQKQRDHHKCAMVHSQGPFGENLFRGYGKPYTGADAVHSWEAEKQHYDYKSNSCGQGKVCGHYTQLVWANTKEAGCASVTCHDGATFIICSYNPPGNFVGEWPYLADQEGSNRSEL